jgi:hypothetical protein
MHHCLHPFIFLIRFLLSGYDDDDDTSLDYIPDRYSPMSTSSDTNMDLTIEYFTSFKITTKNARVWAQNLVAVPHLWVSICNHWCLSLVPLFSKGLLDVSSNCAFVQAHPFTAS